MPDLTNMTQDQWDAMIGRRLWVIKRVAMLPDTSGRYRVRYCACSDSVDWTADNLKSVIGRPGSEVALEADRESWLAALQGEMKGYVDSPGDLRSEPSIVTEFAAAT